MFLGSVVTTAVESVAQAIETTAEAVNQYANDAVEYVELRDHVHTICNMIEKQGFKTYGIINMINRNSHISSPVEDGRYLDWAKAEFFVILDENKDIQRINPELKKALNEAFYSKLFSLDYSVYRINTQEGGVGYFWIHNSAYKRTEKQKLKEKAFGKRK